jgi:hypothetical protein
MAAGMTANPFGARQTCRHKVGRGRRVNRVGLSGREPTDHEERTRPTKPRWSPHRLRSYDLVQQIDSDRGGHRDDHEDVEITNPSRCA